MAEHQRFAASADEVAKRLPADRREALLHHRRVTVGVRRDPGGQGTRHDRSPCINGVIKATDWVSSGGPLAYKSLDARQRSRFEPSAGRSFHGRSHRPSRRLSTLPDVVLATCSVLPDLDDDEGSLIPALEACGLVAEPRVWDDPSVHWADVPLVVVRSTWDYAERRDAFLAWCARVPRVLNSVPVVAWNTDKAYLRTLAAAGIPIVPTRGSGPMLRRGQFSSSGGRPGREAVDLVRGPAHVAIPRSRPRRSAKARPTPARARDAT